MHPDCTHSVHVPLGHTCVEEPEFRESHAALALALALAQWLYEVIDVDAVRA